MTTEPGATERLRAWERDGAPNRKSLAAFGLRVVTSESSDLLAAEKIRCGNCGDDLTVEEIEGHLLSEGRVLPPRSAHTSREAGLDAELLRRSVIEALSAVDDEWIVDEFVDLVIAEYARLAAASPVSEQDPA